MIIDATSIPTDELVEGDLCIVGAGPAGLSVAAAFLGSKHRIYVLETGGEHRDHRSRELSEGESVGYPYFRLSNARAMVFGGSSYIWQEWMRARPLDAIDFQKRRWVADSGWPFGSEELDPFYAKAHDMLGLGPFDYETKRWLRPGEVEPFGEEGSLTSALFRFSNTADFTTMRGKVEASANVCLVLNANVLELVPDASGRIVDRVIASSENPHRFSVKAHEYVLAAGGIGTPRLLLLSKGQSKSGLGNESGLVGQYFMEHPLVRRGALVPSSESPSDMFKPFTRHESNGSMIRGAMVPTSETMQRHGLLNGVMLLTPSDELRASDVYRSLAIIGGSLRGRRSRESAPGHLLGLLTKPAELARAVRALAGRQSRGERVYRLSVTVEQAPNPDSRVSLGKGRDRFGQPVAVLDWRIGDGERRTVRTLQELLDTEIRARGLGRVEGLLGDERPARVFQGEYHQMGTTRMADNPKRGVVDRDCRVHGVENLHIAGASVFPTVGYANPTLTVVALGLRLASVVAGRLRDKPSPGPFW